MVSFSCEVGKLKWFSLDLALKLAMYLRKKEKKAVTPTMPRLDDMTSVTGQFELAKLSEN